MASARLNTLSASTVSPWACRAWASTTRVVAVNSDCWPEVLSASVASFLARPTASPYRPSCASAVMRRISVSISCGFAWQGATRLASSAVTISHAANPCRSARIFLCSDRPSPEPAIAILWGGSKATSGLWRRRQRRLYQDCRFDFTPLTVSLVQISCHLSVVGVFPGRRVGRALLVWGIPGKLADGGPLQRRPVAAAGAAYRGHHPGLRGAHGAMEGDVRHPHLDRRQGAKCFDVHAL